MAKIELKVVLENADSKETMELDCPFESVAADVAAIEADLASASDTSELIKKLQKALAPGTPLYAHFLSVFVRMGHDKAGWHDVIVYIKSVSARDVQHEIDEDKIHEEGQADTVALQIERSTNGPTMYFIEQV